MIDIENQIYTPIAQELRRRFPGIAVSGEYTRTPTQMPFVSIVESDNYPTPEHLSTSDSEKYASLMFEVSVYSNKTGGKKSEAKKIIQVVDDMLYSLNFVRISLSPVPNLENATIYRLVARYRVETDGTFLYRR